MAFNGNRQTCVAWFLRSKTEPYTYTYDCSDIDGVACLSSNTDPDVQRIALCSDGGFSAHPVRWVTSALDRSAGATVFGCDYGSQSSYCNPRTRDVTTNDDCDPNGVNNAGACRDSCWVDTAGFAHNTEEGYDSSATDATLGSDKQCHDGGPGSLSAKCGYGTQSTRCGIGRTIAYVSPYQGGLATRRRRQLYYGDVTQPTAATDATVDAAAAAATSTETGELHFRASAFEAEYVVPPPPPPPLPINYDPNYSEATFFPPPPPESPQPSPPPPPPSPPPPPRLRFDSCMCSCFSEDSNANEGTAQAGWSELALRARATSSVPTAVMYQAHTILTRGRSNAGIGHIWVNGKTEGVLRYVNSPAHQAHTAHLVAGRAQNDADVRGLLLSSNPLPAYMGHVPYWWPDPTTPGYDRLADSVTGPAAIAFWRDTCASLCYRLHDDSAEMIQVDLRPGLYEGNKTDVNPSTCKCYAYKDLANTSYDAGYGASLQAPNDIAMANFLRSSVLVNNYVGKDEHDRGLKYRDYVNLYAAHRDPFDSYFDEASQSSVFHKLALEPGYFVDYSSIVGHPKTYVDMTNVGDINACMRECAKIEHRLERQFMHTMVFEYHDVFADRRCMCSTEDWLSVDNDVHIVHDPLIRNRLVYRLKFCPGVAGGSERSVVYYKGIAAGSASTCYGMPVRIPHTPTKSRVGTDNLRANLLTGRGRHGLERRQHLSFPRRIGRHASH